jgi:cystathionine gamma-lyase
MYPGLPSNKYNKIAKMNASDPSYSGGSGILSFYVNGDLEKCNTFLSSLKLLGLAISLGGVESLI